MAKTLVYHQPGHLSSLEDMRSLGVLCDVTIQVEQEKFQAHKFILAATTKYFEKMFLSEFQESSSNTLSIKDVSAKNMEGIIKFAYTGRITLTEENAISLTKDADYFELVGLKEAGLQFLESCINIQYVYEIYCFAELLGCTSLSKVCKEFMLSHFKDVSLADYYCDFTIDFLSDLLLSGNDKISANIMFEAVMKWILKDADQRSAHLSTLLELIKLSNLDGHFLNNYLFKDKSTAIGRRHGALADDVMCFYKTFKRDKCKDEKSIIAMRRTDCNIVEIYNPISDTWESVKAKRTDKQMIRSATVHNDRLYAIGDTDVLVYDHQNRIWEKRSPMDIERMFCATATLNGFLYACGGYANGSHSNIVERYCSESDEWQTMSPMNCSRAHFALVALQGLLYAIGGYNSNGGLDTVERYDPQKNQWTMLDSKMSEKRFEFGAAVLDEKLYICGGLNGQQDRLCSVEVYDPEIDSWSRVTSMNSARTGCLVVANMGKLWAVGGEDKNGIESLTVEMYDPESHSWTFAQPMNKLKGAMAGGLIPNFKIKRKKLSALRKKLSVKY